MENNQEHKIDKIFKETFENQSVTPPSETWMGIHTYTIGQEEKKPKVWVKYTSLGLLVLLFSGLGFWYYYHNQTTVGKNKLPLLSKELLVKNTKNDIENAGRVLNHDKPDLVNSNPIIQNYLSTLLSHEVDWSGDQPRNEKSSVETQTMVTENTVRVKPTVEIPDSVNKNPDIINLYELLVENTNNGGNDGESKIEEIEPKPLILNDLSDKIQKESERKIVSLPKNLANEKPNFDKDSVDYGNKFSLRHPIINFRLGMYNTSVSINAKGGGENPFNNDVINPNSIYGFSGIFGLAWKLNNKSRISVNFKLISYGAVNAQSKSGAAYVDPLSSTNKPQGTFKYNSTKDIYEYLTPFGYVTQAIDPKLSTTPKDFNANLFGQFSAWQISTNYEHDFVAFRHKKGGIPAMEIYGLVGLNIQKIRKYTYFYSPFKNYDPKDNLITYAPINKPAFTQPSLENGSSIILGYNTGFGIRFQLSKRFGLNISSNYESNINSWVTGLPFTTRLSVLSVESGFFVKL